MRRVRTKDYAFGMNPLGRIIVLGCGWLSLGIGAIGIVVPVLPTAPFVLLAAACFLRTSPLLHAWLTEHPLFGPHIVDFLAGRGLRARTKLLAISTLWASVIASIWLVIPLLAVDLIAATAAVAVTAYLLRLPTCHSENAAS